MHMLHYLRIFSLIILQSINWWNPMNISESKLNLILPQNRLQYTNWYFKQNEQHFWSESSKEAKLHFGTDSIAYEEAAPPTHSHW